METGSQSSRNRNRQILDNTADRSEALVSTRQGAGRNEAGARHRFRLGMHADRIKERVKLGKVQKGSRQE